MKSWNFSLSIFLLFQCCKSNNVAHKDKKTLEDIKQTSGVYNQIEDNSIQLKLNNDSTFLFSIPSGKYGFEGKCCDTLSYGIWALETSRLITLSSPEVLSKKLAIDVDESVDKDSGNVYFRILNPIEQEYSRDNSKRRNLQYVIMAFADDLTLLSESKFDLNSNIVVLANPFKKRIKFFQVLIYPGPTTFLTEDVIIKTATETYFPKKLESNHFEVNIPSLSYNYLKIKRLNKDFVMVVNSNTLEWDGHLFKKSNAKSGNPTILTKSSAMK